MERNESLKIVGIVTMLIDHIGAILFPQYILLRIIGRISFPLFCYQAFISTDNTKNVGKYIGRLFIFAILSEIVYIQLHSQSLNIMFTFVYGVLVMYLWGTNKLWGQFLSVVLFVISFYLPWLQYSWYGIGIMLGFMCFKHSKVLQMITFSVFTVMFTPSVNQAQLFALFAIPFMTFLDTGFVFKIKLPKYFFYFFYPVHLQILLVISYYIK